MARIEVISVTKKYRDSTAVDDVNMDVQDREFVVLLGPSGCGKSTLLKLVAGLEELTAGEIYIDGRLVNYVRPAQRDVAMVFQNYALYPHMTVADNIGFPLRMNRLPKSDVRAQVEGVARVLGIEELLRRRPEQLSGGQRQRVALGRAIIRQPKVFLMDEPLSNLDAKLRVQMREELMELHRRVEATIIYVTHDQTEAMTMANRIVVLRDGRIQQTGRPQTVYDDPANTYVAAFVGSPAMNLIEGELSRSSGELTFANGDVSVVVPRSYYDAASSYRDTAVTLGIRSEDVLTDHAGGARMNAIVDFTESVGSDLFLKLRVGQSALMARTDARSKVVEGQRVGVEFRPSGIRLFDRMGDAFTRAWDTGGPQNASP